MELVDQVISLTASRTERRADGALRLVIDDTYSIMDALSSCRDGRPQSEYYCLRQRLLVALDEAGKLPAEPRPMAPEKLTSLYGELEATNLLLSGQQGYDRAKELGALVLEARGIDGQDYLFGAARGGEVSNDHYPYYELLSSMSGRGNRPVLLSHNRFYYDVAGYEGLEWPAVCLGLFLVGTAAFLVGLSIVFAIGALRERSSRGTGSASG